MVTNEFNKQFLIADDRNWDFPTKEKH